MPDPFETSCGRFADVATHSNDLLRQANVLADDRTQTCDTLLLLGVVRRQPPDRRQVSWRLHQTVFVRPEKPIVGAEHETAIAGLDLLGRGEQFCESHDDLVGVQDPGVACSRCEDASIREHAQEEEHDDRDAEAELQPPNELNGFQFRICPPLATRW
jgi:hypothetical protein